MSSEVIYVNHPEQCLAMVGAWQMLAFPLPFYPGLSAPPSPLPVVGGSPGAGTLWSPASPADTQTLPGSHLLPTPPLPGASPQGPAPQPHRAFAVSSCCFLLRWKRARNNVSHCQHHSLPAGNNSVYTQRHGPPGWLASCTDLISDLSLSPKQPRGRVEVFLFLDSF